MATEQEICTFIKNRQSIVYLYEKAGRAIGERTGAPHIIYRTTRSRSVIVEIWKTGGVQTNPGLEIPGGRSYSLANIVILRVNGNFQPQKTKLEGGSYFNPAAGMYADTICSVYE